MKSTILISSTLLLLSAKALTQTPCSNVRIQTSVVAKPAEASTMIAGNCNEISISWKGNTNQSYIVSGAYADNSPLPETTANCDNAGICSVTLTVNPGSTLHWNIQAIETIDGRTFYSYPLRGEYTACADGHFVDAKTNTAAIANKAVPTEMVRSKTELMVYPNPVTGELTIKWSGAYKGNARLSILDASGKTVKFIDLKKQLPDHLDRVIVSNLTAGLYFMQIKMQDGNVLSAKFVKQ